MKHQHQAQYTRSLISNARRMRREMTSAEEKLWEELRRKELGVKFRRQVPYGRFILDFYCIKAALAIEVDGIEHHTAKGMQHDQDRDNYLNSEGIKVMRIDNADVMANINGVVDSIFDTVRERFGEITDPHEETPS